MVRQGATLTFDIETQNGHAIQTNHQKNDKILSTTHFASLETQRHALFKEAVKKSVFFYEYFLNKRGGGVRVFLNFM